MTSVRAVQDAAFKNCCLRSGRYDGAKRHHFFPRVAERRVLLGVFQFQNRAERCSALRSAGRRTWVIIETDRPTFTNLPAVPKQNPHRELATHTLSDGRRPTLQTRG